MVAKTFFAKAAKIIAFLNPCSYNHIINLIYPEGKNNAIG